MLRLTAAEAAAEAAVWASTGSTLRSGWELAKANATGTPADTGDQALISFPPHR